jgi:hypothetical protein
LPDPDFIKGNAVNGGFPYFHQEAACAESTQDLPFRPRWPSPDSGHAGISPHHRRNLL